MTNHEFDEFRKAVERRCYNILITKGNDYASGDDRLINFKRIAARIGVPALTVWAVYFMKHVDAILEYVKSGKLKSESIQGRFDDVRNYADLGAALVEEKRHAGNVVLQSFATLTELSKKKANRKRVSVESRHQRPRRKAR